MKRHGRLFDKIFEFGNLLTAARKAMKAKKDRKEVMELHFNLENELLRLKNEVQTKTYRPGPLSTFIIHDPKERVISAPALRDRVLHHAIINVIGPVLDRRFISHSYSCREGKGMHLAVRYAQKCSRKSSYFFKTDIAGYFPSIDHDVLKEILDRIFKDPDLLWLLETIIDGDKAGKVGLPIGSLTSQWFANLYLDPFDHYVKDELGEKNYLRYMDDMLLFGGSRDEMHRLKMLAESFLNDELHLTLKERATILSPVDEGLPFLGLMIYPNLIRVRQTNKKRSLRHLKTRIEEYARGEITEEEFSQSVSSITEHLKTGNTYRLRRNIFSKMLL